MTEQIRRHWEERQQREQQELCPPAAAFFDTVSDWLIAIIVAGGDQTAKTAALTTLDELAEPFWPQVKSAHFPSLWSKHRCVKDIYD